MKHILVIGGHSGVREDVEELELFCEGVQKAYPESTVEPIHVDRVQFVIAPGVFSVRNAITQQEVSSADLVILRNKMRTYNTVAYALSRYCAVQNITFFNDYSAYYPGTKAAQAVVFYEQQLPFLKTVYAMDNAAFRNLITTELTLPFVLKDAFGAKGTSNYLVTSLEELDKHLQSEPDTAFIAQEYCPNECDYRILLMGDQELIFKRQGSADTHLNNTSTGGKAVLAPHEIPTHILEQSRKLAQVMQLTIAGIDVMPKLGTEAFYFIETNAQPQVFTGVFQDEKQALFTQFLNEKLR